MTGLCVQVRTRVCHQSIFLPTAHSFSEMTEYLLMIPGVKVFLSGHIVMHQLSAKYRKSAYRPHFYNIGNRFFNRFLANHYKIMYLTIYHYEIKKKIEEIY